MKQSSAKFYLPYHYFICPDCDEDAQIPPKEFAAHVQDVHKIYDGKGERSLILHINKKPRHMSTYEWIIGGKTFYEYYG